ncbi:gliding motility-associated ABC transporter ATP-binding subunit GldA [Taibaiella sp. KBW10]|uniref:gliding motility-associated ABC transporter ATP-binding subunit GldA n=1 Tax=Taibaiella sp. KBW10 TaxID=2153357 RepID=UPI000F5919F6|nr:gliding motility-associated ABC transporter ATP-binding subunit GldA [Taibaiella sp. KBW10]RQO31381.1 gliding motility-associated ABC transporter ATP-binding subunit GldA [Taibaiella sp. KBW10]
MSIIVKGLTRKYGEQLAVNHISFEIGKGSIVGFLGPNGAGKSTTMKMLTTYVPPTSGMATVCGFDIEKNVLDVRKHVGYLPESNPLYYDMYVREYLHFAAGVHQLSNKNSRVEEMIAMTGLAKEVNKKLGQLSKGYKQRVGLAQAMIHNPDVLILDEPTSGLDPNQLADIRDLILQIGKEKTVLLSTHIMQEVEAMCSRVIIINDGKIVADDALDSIQQHQHNKNTLIVQFNKTIEAAQLQHLSGLESVRALDDNRWALQTAAPDQLRKALMQWSLQHDIAIESLQTESKSLEEVFRMLTLK